MSSVVELHGESGSAPDNRTRTRVFASAVKPL